MREVTALFPTPATSAVFVNSYRENFTIKVDRAYVVVSLHHRRWGKIGKSKCNNRLVALVRRKEGAFEQEKKSILTGILK